MAWIQTTVPAFVFAALGMVGFPEVVRTLRMESAIDFRWLQHPTPIT